MRRTYIQTVTLLLVSLALPSLHTYNFAHEAKKITSYFEENQIDSAFAKELYSSIEWATSKFTKNFSFEELERFVPFLYLDYISHFVLTNHSDTAIALIWPITNGKDHEIHNLLEDHFEIVSYKRILFQGKSGYNFIEQVPRLKAADLYQLYFNPPHNKYNPVRVYLLKRKNSDQTPLNILKQWCQSKIQNCIYITETHSEAIKLSQTVFNHNSINFIRALDREKFDSQNSKKHIAIFKQAFEDRLDDVILTDEASFCAHGYKDCNRLKYFANKRDPSTNLQSRHLKRKEEISLPAERPFMLESKFQDFTNIGFNISASNNRHLSSDDLLYNPKRHFYFNGVKFTTLEVSYFQMKRQNHPAIGQYREILLKKNR